MLPTRCNYTDTCCYRLLFRGREAASGLRAIMGWVENSIHLLVLQCLA